MVFDEATIKRFWRKVDIRGDDECWLNSFSPKDEYGRIYANGRIYKSHQFSLINHTRLSIPRGMCVCHSCDTPRCVNPKHLWLGTHEQNRLDCVSKGRMLTWEKNRKLTDDQILEIRSYTRYRGLIPMIMKKYNISHTLAEHVRYGTGEYKNWVHGKYVVRK